MSPGLKHGLAVAYTVLVTPLIVLVPLGQAFVRWSLFEQIAWVSLVICGVMALVYARHSEKSD